jgi:hypothetical protein
MCLDSRHSLPIYPGKGIEARKVYHPQDQMTLDAANPEKEFIGFTSSNVIIKRNVSDTILKSKMVDVVELASTSTVMSFVRYAQDRLRLPQYLGYTSIDMVGDVGFELTISCSQSRRFKPD